MRTTILVMALLTAPSIAAAHFPYIHVDGEGERRALHAYFGHGVESTDAKYFPRLTGAKVWRLEPGGTPQPLSLAPVEGSLTSEPVDPEPAAYLFEKDQGVVSRNGDYLLTNYAKAFSGADAWAIDTSQNLRLDVAPERTGSRLTLTVRWDSKPAAGVDVVVEQGDAKQAGKTDSQGRFTAETKAAGLYTARAWRIDKTPGKRDGKKYDDVRYYSTLTLDVIE